MDRRPFPRWLLVSNGVTLALVVLCVRLLLESRSALLSGERAVDRGDRLEAIRHFQDAARLYLPGSPYVYRALDRLETMATAATQSGDGTVVRAALEAERAAILSSRALYTPNQSRLPKIENRLAQVLAAAEDRSVAPGFSFEARAAWHLERLARRPGPDLTFVLMALVGLCLWVGGASGFFYKGLDANLRPRRPHALAFGVIFVLGMGLFLAGLRFA